MINRSERALRKELLRARTRYFDLSLPQGQRNEAALQYAIVTEELSRLRFEREHGFPWPF